MATLLEHDLLFRGMIALLAVSMQLVRWRSRRYAGWSANWPAFKARPVDGVLLTVWTALMSLVLAVYVFAPGWLESTRWPCPLWARLLGFPVGLFGVFLLAWADISLGKNLSVIPEIKTEHTLTTQGPYRWIRHPIYSAGSVLCFSYLFITANWLVGAICLGGALLLYGSRMPREEQMLIEHFGSQYRLYAQSTGRLLPRLFPASRSSS